MMKQRNIKFKKAILSCASFALTVVTLSSSVFALSKPLSIFTNNEMVQFEEAQPYINEQDLTMIPFRKLSEAVDIKIDWQSPYVIAEGKHQATGENLVVKVKASDWIMHINDTAVPIATPTTLIDGHTYIPLRLFVETFGYKIDWDNGTITIEALPLEKPSYSGSNSSNTPDEPSVPEIPETPDEPSVPEIPETPDEPSVPEVPETPDEPSVPETPETPDEPGVPEIPETPDEPSVPEIPETPDEPSVPEIPETPDEPSVPEIPEIPDIPVVPEIPSIPDIPETPDEPNIPEVPAPATYAERVTELVNIERRKVGLKPLTLDAKVSAVALEKSKDMSRNNYFDHTSPTYGSPFDMLKKFGVNYRSAGENIAMGYRTPEAVVEGWMNSSGHRANILNSSFTHIGIGYDTNGHYWTQMFVSY